MTELHETIRGARLFDGQIPQLVRSLERIAIAIERVVDNMEDAEDEVEEETDVHTNSQDLTRPPFYTTKENIHEG